MTQGTVSRIAIPVGDPNGIGPEIALKTVAAYAGRDDVALTLFGPANVLRDTADMLGLGEALAVASVEPSAPVLQDGFRPGEINAQAGAAAVDRPERGAGVPR